MTDVAPSYKIAFGPALRSKIKPGDSYWPRFNASFTNVEEEWPNVAARIYEGQPITTWHAKRWRTGKNYILGQHIGIDFDTDDKRSSLAVLEKDPFVKRYASFLYTTPSHTEETPRARAIFLLGDPIFQPANYVAAVEALLFVFRSADAKCKDPVRFFYGGKPGQCEIATIGETLPIQEVKRLIHDHKRFGDKAKKASANRRNQAPPNAEEIQSALNAINPWQIDYDEWVSILMAIHSEYPGSDGMALADSWGQGYEGEVERKWRSFNSTGNYSGRVGLGSLFKIAYEKGWQRNADG